MGIFNSSSNGEVKADTTTIITQGAVVKGELNLNCNLYIDGQLDGKISSSATVTIGKKGSINGEIEAKKLVVQGCIEGNIVSDRTDVLTTGSIKGIITSNELMIEPKAKFEGESRLKGSPVFEGKRPSAKEVDNQRKQLEIELQEQ